MATTTINRVALYGRVSTTNHGQDVTSRRSWVVVGEYIDDGFSGAKDSRPALNRLMADAHRRRFDAVLVWKLDRFGRSLRHLVNALAELEARGIGFVSQIIEAMAEFERALIQERVKAGMRNARAKGRRIGRPPQTPLSPELREVIGDTYAQGGTSLRALAARFGTSLATIQRSVGVYQRAAK